MRHWIGAACVIWLATSASAQIFPIEEVRPGQRGIGRTVFEGARIEEFDVEVIGVIDNGPKQRVVLAKLTGGPLEHTGVIAGMSGSPVYIDGRLLGAVALGFPFAKEPIAGITPFGEMLAATETDAPRPAAARARVRYERAGPLRHEDLLGAIDAALTALRAPSLRLTGGADLAGIDAQALRPLSLPLVFSGFDASAFDAARSLFAGRGLVPVMGTAPANASFENLPDLEPGSAVGVSLVEGDLDLSVTGTVTHIDGDMVYAFGHPFYNLGPTQFPMKKAYVYSVFPSLYQSWKIATATEPVGTIVQDRVTAIAGRLGPTPRMIPVEVKLETSRGQSREYAFRIVEDELFTPLLAYMSLFSVLQSNERTFGTSTMKVDARIEVAGRTAVRLRDLYTQQQPALRSALLVAAPLTFLMANDLESVTIDKVSVAIESQETVQAATVIRAWLDKSGPVQPGSSQRLSIQLRTYRGTTETHEMQVEIPATAPPGSYQLLVGDAETLNQNEEQELGSEFVARDLDQLIRAINSIRKQNYLYARLYRQQTGAVVSGEYMPALPPSILRVLQGPDQSGQVVPVQTASAWSGEVATAHALRGSRLLSVEIRR